MEKFVVKKIEIIDQVALSFQRAFLHEGGRFEQFKEKFPPLQPLLRPLLPLTSRRKTLLSTHRHPFISLCLLCGNTSSPFLYLSHTDRHTAQFIIAKVLITLPRHLFLVTILASSSRKALATFDYSSRLPPSHVSS